MEIGPLKWTKNMSPFKRGSLSAKEKSNFLIPINKFLFTMKSTWTVMEFQSITTMLTSCSVSSTDTYAGRGLASGDVVVYVFPQVIFSMLIMKDILSYLANNTLNIITHTLQHLPVCRQDTGRERRGWSVPLASQSRWWQRTLFNFWPTRQLRVLSLIDLLFQDTTHYTFMFWIAGAKKVMKCFRKHTVKLPDSVFSNSINLFDSVFPQTCTSLNCKRFKAYIK